ncbi:MAG: hypothetical protein K2Z25_14375 [Beijerinckiaceae bacterium]|nr:hypothetical protein [Beijerinckiaceae bacterium]
MDRKPLIAILALLITGGTAFARPHAIPTVISISAESELSPKTKAARFRASRAVSVRNPELTVPAQQQTSRTVAAG